MRRLNKGAASIQKKIHMDRPMCEREDILSWGDAQRRSWDEGYGGVNDCQKARKYGGNPRFSS
jgi:hypothetical protein